MKKTEHKLKNRKEFNSDKLPYLIEGLTVIQLSQKFN
jgi:hypothetical protein